MDAILFSAKPAYVEDAFRHLASNARLYWEVGFSIKREKYVYPMLGYIHAKGRRVECKVVIEKIRGFSRCDYENIEIAKTIKPAPWLKEWAEDIGNIRSHNWKHTLVITQIEPFSYVTTAFRKLDGTAVKHAPQGYIRVRSPE